MSDRLRQARDIEASETIDALIAAANGRGIWSDEVARTRQGTSVETVQRLYPKLETNVAEMLAFAAGLVEHAEGQAHGWQEAYLGAVVMETNATTRADAAEETIDEIRARIDTAAKLAHGLPSESALRILAADIHAVIARVNHEPDAM